MQAIRLPLSGGESLAIGLVVAVVVMVPLLWAPVSHFHAMTRTAAHVLLAVLLGLAVTEIALDRNSEGETSIAEGGLRVLFLVLIGFLGPSIFGLGAAKLISLGYPVAVLWALVLLLVLVLFDLGRSFGCISVPIALALLYLILRYTHTGTEIVAAYVVAWLLLLSGVRHAIGHGLRSADADKLSGGSHLPRHLWWLLWLAGTLAALYIGGKLLIVG